MNVKRAYERFKSNTGWYQFVTRSLLFFGIVIITQLVIFLWLRHTSFFLHHLQLGPDYYISWLTGLRKTDFLNAAIFGVIAFIIWNRDKLRHLKETTHKRQETIFWGILAAVLLFLHYALKYVLVQTPHPSAAIVLLGAIAKYVLVIGFIAAVAIACYTRQFLASFIRQYRLSLGIFVLVTIAYFFLIQLFQVIWYHLSYFVGMVIHFLLSLSFQNVFFSPGTLTAGPQLGVNGFIVAISSACSGIDSLLLFISLYTLLFVLDYKRLHAKRMWLLLIPGLIGTVAYNILRIYLLVLVGVFYNPEFAVDTFHTNAGWILFLLFFMLFWHLGSKWVYKKRG